MDIIVAPCQFLKNLILFLQLLWDVSATKIHGQKKEKMGAGGRWEEERRFISSSQYSSEYGLLPQH